MPKTVSNSSLTLPFASIVAHDVGTHFEAELTQQEDAGVYTVRLSLRADTPSVPPPLKLEWQFDQGDGLCIWRPDKGAGHVFPTNWQNSQGLQSRSTTQAPVVCVHTTDGQNRLTLAADDALHQVRIKVGLYEYTFKLLCEVFPFEGIRQPSTTFDFTLRLDTRALAYFETLSDVSDWWAAMPDYTPLPVPEAAKLPVYSTWYSYHQELEADTIVEQCRIARELGCESVIVDDGWQTLDSGGAYAFTGDWEPERLNDMKTLVERVHALGMKFVLWYSVPFVGFKSSKYAHFEGKYLSLDERLGCGVLDPCYPEVRAYLIETYVTAMRDWKLDGFKLDFVDAFKIPATGSVSNAPGKDYDCAYEAADKLMRDIADALRAIHPKVLIEFRQSYVGPKMRRYGNFFRVNDCPMDIGRNRCGIMDIRLLAGDTAVHSDMLVWPAHESPEFAAKQLLHVLFSVPQISTKLDQIPAAHHKMLAHYLSFWRDYRDVLLDGKLEPMHPQAMYPAIRASKDGRAVIALYQCPFAQLPDAPARVTEIVNATDEPAVTLTNTSNYTGRASIFDCQGSTCGDVQYAGEPTISIPVPPSGRVRLEQI